MQDARAFAFRGVAEEDGELLGRLITQLYSPTIPPPPEILVPAPVDDGELRAELLSEVAGRRVVIRHPKRGDGRRMVELAQSNAKVRFGAAHSRAERAERALFGLKKVLRLQGLPRRIECYDNSHVQGSDPVGSMVVFADGRASRKGYRIFRIKQADPGDDYGAMLEVLGRRLARGLAGDEKWPLPDLLVVDGGRGQLSMAVRACREAGVDVIGLDGRPIQPEVGGPALRVVSTKVKPMPNFSKACVNRRNVPP